MLKVKNFEDNNISKPMFYSWAVNKQHIHKLQSNCMVNIGYETQ